jgi:hypothetical protein
MGIAEAFLICALAVPSAMVPRHDRHYDVGIFKFIVDRYKKYQNEDNRRVYMIGGDTDLLAALRTHNLRTWRVTIDPKSPFDIVAFANALPFARESGLVVIYMLSFDWDAWGSMRLFAEATRPLSENGIIAFYSKMSPHFAGLAKAKGFELLPFRWYDMELWRKPRGSHDGGGQLRTLRQGSA